MQGELFFFFFFSNVPSDNIGKLILWHLILIEMHISTSTSSFIIANKTHPSSLPWWIFTSPSYFPCTNKFYILHTINILWQFLRTGSWWIFISPSFILLFSLSLSLITPSQLALYIICSTKECVYWEKL